MHAPVIDFYPAGLAAYCTNLQEAVHILCLGQSLPEDTVADTPRGILSQLPDFVSNQILALIAMACEAITKYFKVGNLQFASRYCKVIIDAGKD